MTSRIHPLQAIAAVAALGAAVVHAVVAVDHWALWWGYGALFVVAAAAQLCWAIAVMISRHRGILLAGCIGNVAAIVMWVVTRTLGQPVGPLAGTVEPVGSSGSLTVALEVVAVACAGWLFVRIPSTPRWRLVRPGLSVGVGVVLLLGATSFAASTAITGHHHSGSTGHHDTNSPGQHHSDHHSEDGSGHGHDETSTPAPGPSSRSTPPPQPTEKSSSHESTENSTSHEHDHGH